MEKIKLRTTGLERLILGYFNTSGTTEEPDNAQLEIVAKNWQESGKYFKKHFKGHSYSAARILKRLRKEFNVGFTEEEIRDLYDELILPDVDCLRGIASFAQEFSVPLTEPQTKKFWNNFFRGKWGNYDLEDAVKYLGKPDLNQEELNYACNDFLRDLAGLKVREKGTERMPRLEDLSALLKLVSLTPQWDMETAGKAYEYMIPLLDNPFAEKKFIFLRDIGVSPPVEKVRKFYRELFARKERYSSSREAGYIAESLERVLKLTNLSLEQRDRKLILRFYRQHLSSDNLEAIRKMEKIIGIPCDAEIVNLVFGDMLRRGDTASINHLSAELKITPAIQESIVQEAYRNLFREGKLDSALKMYLFSDIEPVTDPKTIEMAYKKLETKLRKKERSCYTLGHTVDFQTFGWMSRRFPEQTGKFVKRHLRTMIHEGRFPEIEKLLSSTNVSPEPEEAYVLACKKGDWKLVKSIFEANSDSITRLYPEYARLYQYVV